MRIGICEDEEVQCRILEKYLKEWAVEQHLSLETVLFRNAESFLFRWEEDKGFDLLILDIEMGKISGIELAVKLREDGETVPILFVTGYDSYMAQGYEVEALHYLLKPVNKEKLYQVLQRLRKNQKAEPKILLHTESGSLFLIPSEIWYIEAAAHQCVLTTASGKQMLKHTISDLKKLLENEKSIVLAHRSYLVNLQHVSMIVKTEIIMDNGCRIPVSRSSTKIVNEAFIRLYKGEGRKA